MGTSSARRSIRPTGTTFTVVSNTSEGAWPLVRYLGDALLG